MDRVAVPLVWRALFQPVIHRATQTAPWIHRGFLIWFAPPPCNTPVRPLRSQHYAAKLSYCPICFPSQPQLPGLDADDA